MQYGLLLSDDDIVHTHCIIVVKVFNGNRNTLSYLMLWATQCEHWTQCGSSAIACEEVSSGMPSIVHTGTMRCLQGSTSPLSKD